MQYKQCKEGRLIKYNNTRRAIRCRGAPGWMILLGRPHPAHRLYVADPGYKSIQMS